MTVKMVLMKLDVLRLAQAMSFSVRTGPVFHCTENVMAYLIVVIVQMSLLVHHLLLKPAHHTSSRVVMETA